MITQLHGNLIPLHGLGGRSDLPAPGWLVAYGSAVVVLVSFYATAALWSTSRFGRRDAGNPVPVLGRALDSVIFHFVLRTLGILLLLTFLGVAWFGPDDNGQLNPAPTWLYAWFWVGLVPASLLCGPVWAGINPLRTIAAGLRRVLAIGSLSLPARLGLWPAAVSLLAFLWLELVYDQAASSRVVAIFVTGYAVIHVLAGAAFGSEWFSRADGFEAYSSMLARAAVLGRRADGRIVARNPLDGLAATPPEPDLTPVIVVVLGSTVFDGLSRMTWWSDVTAGSDRVAYLRTGSVGLLGAIAAVALTYWLATLLTRPSLNEQGVAAGPEFAHTLIPIVIGYTVAHYFSFAVFQGQQGILLANDPFARGWDLLGLRGEEVDYALVSPAAIARVQILSIVAGHILAIISAHDRAVTLLRPRDVLRGQYAMVSVMVLYTAVGIALVAGT